MEFVEFVVSIYDFSLVHLKEYTQCNDSKNNSTKTNHGKQSRMRL